MFYLHPTMYLLIRALSSSNNLAYVLFTSHYVSINSTPFFHVYCIVALFTSHYVSINSGLIPTIFSNVPLFTSHYVSINSVVQTQTKILKQ